MMPLLPSNMITVWCESRQCVEVGAGYKRMDAFGLRIDDNQGGYDVGRGVNGMILENRYQKVRQFGMQLETCIAVWFSC